MGTILLIVAVVTIIVIAANTIYGEYSVRKWEKIFKSDKNNLK